MSDPRSELEYARRLSASVEKIIAGPVYCWLVSRTKEGVRSRPMGRISAGQGEDAWTLRFLIDRRSRKAEEVRRSDRVALIFQKDDEEAYISLEGSARLIEAKQDVQALWNDEVCGRHFPTDDDRVNAGFIEVKVTHMELWIRGLTPEPFGLRPAILERDSDGSWRCTG
jgi:general stress protein 26